MKKIIAFLLTLILCFGFIGCSDSQDESEELVEMQEVQPSGTVNLGEELAVFSKLLDNNYINITAQAYYFGQNVDLEVNLKRTTKGYDVVVTIEREGGYVEKFYYIGDTVVRGSSFGEEFHYSQRERVEFVDQLDWYNQTIDSQTDSKLIYHVLKPIIHKFSGFETDLEGNFTELFNTLIGLANEYQDASLYDFLVALLLKDEQSGEILKQNILDFCSGNPSVAVFIDRIEEFINTKLSEENKINIKAYVDTLQENSGVTTEEFVELLKVEIPSIEQNLRVPEDGESIYEYLRSYLRVISLNTFAKNFLNTDKTFVEYLDEVIESSKQIEFEYAVNWFISNYFIKQNVDGEIVIGDHLNTFLQAQMVVRDSVAKLDIDVDDEGRPTKVVGLLTFYYSCTDQGETFDFDREMSINAKIDYKKNSSAFKIPEEALQSA